MPFDNLLLERDDAVALVTINRPQVLNALNMATLDELRRVILDLKRDESVRAVILTGSGEKAFVAGADINELAVQTPIAGREHALAGQHVLDLLEHMGKPVIAAINGYALGGGCELALACALRIAADTARLGQPEIDLDSALLHREASARNRSTVLSMNSMVSFLGFSLTAALAGQLAAHTSVQVAMVVVGAFSVLGAVGYLPALRAERARRRESEPVYVG